MASESSTDPAPATQNVEPTNQRNEYHDAEQNYQPTSLKFWTVMLGMYFSIFLVALVCFDIASFEYSVAHNVLTG